MPSLNDYIGLTVPSRLIVPIMVFISGSILLTRNILSYEIVLPIVSLSLADLASSVLNSISDIEIDKISNKNRPLIKKKVRKKEAALFAALLSFSSIVSSAFISLFFIVVVVLRLFFEFLYSSLQLKRVFLLNIFLASLAYGAIPLFAAWVVFGMYESVPSLFFFFYVISFVMAPVKDIKDYHAEIKKNIRTLPVVLGPNKLRIVLPSMIIIPFLMFFVLSIVYQPKLIIPTLVSIIILIFFFKILDEQILMMRRKKVKSWLGLLGGIIGVSIQLIYAVGATVL